MRTFMTFVLALSGCSLGEVTPGDEAPPNQPFLAGCATSCHGEGASNAPPKDNKGNTATTMRGVGAHAAHLEPQPGWHAKIECSDCHKVPATISDAGHMDGDGVAELNFATRVGATTWNGTTCTAQCHGSAALGGSKPTPTWTLVDGSQSQCGSCHGAPPPAPHPNDPACATCHPTLENDNKTFRDPASHINGKVDLSNDGGGAKACSACHGSATNAAPPKALGGGTATTEPGVGAHQAHLKTSTWRHEIVCASCHAVPVTVDAPGHQDGDNSAELKFDTLNPMATYTKGTTTCANLYCHGNGRGSNGQLSWVIPGALTCTACHAVNGTNMSSRHGRHINGENMTCNECHATVVNQAMTIIDAKLHINGIHEIKMANGTYNANDKSCANTTCHGTLRW